MLRPGLLPVTHSAHHATVGGEPAAATTHDAWAALAAEVQRFVRARVAASDVDDVVQEVLVALATHEAERREAQRIGALATTIARRTVAEHHRRRAREHQRLARAALEPIDAGGEPLEAAERALAGVLAMFLHGITPAHAEAVRAVDVEGRSQAEVARALGVPLSTLRTRVQRGRAELRALVAEHCRIELDARGRVLACESKSGGVCGCADDGGTCA